VALGVFVLASAILLAQGYALKRMPGTAATLATGAAAGLLNGGFGIGGPPVILFFFSTSAGAAVGRASIIAFFIATDAIGLSFLWREGLVTQASFWRFAVFLAPMLLGIWLGNRGFIHADPVLFRRWTLRVLMGLAVLTAGQGLMALAGSSAYFG
jgi:uncharacterized membrane protein YfcA